MQGTYADGVGDFLIGEMKKWEQVSGPSICYGIRDRDIGRTAAIEAVESRILDVDAFF